MENPDMALAVEFFTKAKENPRESKKAGRAIYEDVEYVRIKFPGDNKRELVAPAHESHYHAGAKAQMTYAERFDAVYEGFKKSSGEMIVGTPLAVLTNIPESRRAELATQNIRTVEQLAMLPDNVIKKMGMGFRKLVDDAKEYMARGDQNAEIEALKAQIAELQASMTSKPAAPALDDQFSGMSDDDLRNMLQDATGEAVHGRTGRDTMIERLKEIAAEKEAA